MKRPLARLSLGAALCLAAAISASADTIYDNGPVNGTIEGWTISDGNEVSESFTLSSSAILTGAQVGLWVLPGDNPTTVEWSIGTSPGAGDLGSGTASLTNNFQFLNEYLYDIDESTFSFSDTLGAGTYWFSLQKASTPNGDRIFWDDNNGPSMAWAKNIGYLDGATCEQYTGIDGSCSESFQLYGTESGVTPEPAGLLLMGFGLLVLGLYVRHKFVRQRRVSPNPGGRRESLRPSGS